MPRPPRRAVPYAALVAAVTVAAAGAGWAVRAARRRKAVGPPAEPGPAPDAAPEPVPRWCRPGATLWTVAGTPARTAAPVPRIRLGRRGKVLLAVAAAGTAAVGTVAVLAGRPGVTSVAHGQSVTLRADSGAELGFAVSSFDDPYGSPARTYGTTHHEVTIHLRVHNAGPEPFESGWRVEARLADQHGRWAECTDPRDESRRATGAFVPGLGSPVLIDPLGFTVLPGQTLSMTSRCSLLAGSEPARFRVALRHDGEVAEWRIASARAS